MGKGWLSHHGFPLEVATCSPLPPGGAGGPGECMLCADSTAQTTVALPADFLFTKIGKSAGAATWLLLPGTALTINKHFGAAWQHLHFLL